MSRRLLRNKIKKGLTQKSIELPPSTSGQLFSYNIEHYTEENNIDFQQYNCFNQDKYNNWLNIHNIQHIEKIDHICDTLKLDRLTKQAIFDINQRPKFQEYDSYCYLSIKSVLPTESSEIKT